MVRILRSFIFVLCFINFLQAAGVDVAVYGLTEEGKIYYRKEKEWVLLDDTTQWAHIAAGAHGQLYGITHVPYRADEDTNKDYPTAADIEKWPTLLDGGDISLRLGVSVENPMGTSWIKMPSRKLTYGRLDHFIGVAAGQNRVIACTVPKYRDVLIRFDPFAGDVNANAVAPWQEIKGTAYAVAVDPVQDTSFIVDDWQKWAGGNTYSAVIGHIYSRPYRASGWRNISPYCEGHVTMDNINRLDQYVGEEGWGKTLHVCAINSNIIQIAAGNNTLLGIGKNGSIFVNTDPANDKYTSLDPAPIRLPALYSMVSQSRPFIAAGVRNDGANEIWLVQRQTIQIIQQQNQLYYEGQTTKTASQGFVTGRNLETASFVFRRKGTEINNKTGFGWELMYSSIDTTPEQKFIFKEIAIGSFNPPKAPTIKDIMQNFFKALPNKPK
ncbi:MAG: hypothetical protein WCW33_00765 [Candidatus Babeliales bacterium]|jgi:hypothetical protein